MSVTLQVEYKQPSSARARSALVQTQVTLASDSQYCGTTETRHGSYAEVSK
jgi:hypothetical protein